jgi:RNA polymerase sigma-70 factor (ECF subfamily)
VTSPLLPFELPDAVLVRRFLDGEERAFRLLYDRHTPRLKMTLRRMLGRQMDDVDDLVQDTWLATCRGLHGYRGDAKFGTWLTSIGVRTTLNHLTRAGSRETEAIGDPPSREDGGAAASVDIERALASLSDHQRIVVVLHEIEGFTHDEIAEQLGIAPGTSKATLSRARQVLRALLAEPSSTQQVGVSNGTR